MPDIYQITRRIMKFAGFTPAGHPAAVDGDTLKRELRRACLQPW